VKICQETAQSPVSQQQILESYYMDSSSAQLAYIEELLKKRDERRRFNKEFRAPECLSDIVTFENNKTLAKNPCIDCRFWGACSPAFKEKDQYIEDHNLDCFGNPAINLLTAAPEKCRQCKIRDTCSEFVYSSSHKPQFRHTQ
jgi:hypothetical protein